ncbi:MAG: transporter suffix domain-containing protein [Mariniphaga sp.]
MNYKKLRFRTGIVMISISIVIFLALFAVPFISMDAKLKITLGTILIVAAEVLFWGGTILIGKEVYNKFMTMLKSGDWLNKKKEE